jgi:adenylate cyclase
MWQLKISGPDDNLRTVTIEPGELTLGRRVDNDLVLSDNSTSRHHARIEWRGQSDPPVIRDLNSANGTLVNERRIPPHESCSLARGDYIQIGLHTITVDCCDRDDLQDDGRTLRGSACSGTLTMDSRDPRTDLMCRVARRLNTVADPRLALVQVSELVRQSLEAAHCVVILAGDRSRTNLGRAAGEIVDEAVRRRTGVALPALLDGDTSLPLQAPDAPGFRAALCVPVMRAGELDALIYLDRTDPGAEPFSRADLELIEAISHIVALTIERLSISERIGEEHKLHRLLQSYLPPARVEDLLQNYLRTGRLPGLAEQQATVLFADIAESTKMAERLGARLFGESLQRYYEDMTQIVSDHDGFLEKYLGDGVMAVFGMADGNSQPEQCAVRAGLAMLDSVETHYDLYNGGIQIGVGINSGPVVAGYVRTRDRVDFTILGDTVNVAHGLQSLARPNRLMIGPATCARVARQFAIRDLGTTLLKGREEPLQVHEVLRDEAYTSSSLLIKVPSGSQSASSRLTTG